MLGNGFDCEEWTLPVDSAGTVLAVAKHITPRINSSVLYTDIAATIDGGGEHASEKDRRESLLGACGRHGGMVAVKVNASDPYYSSAEYKNNMAKPQGISSRSSRLRCESDCNNQALRLYLNVCR